MKEKEFNEHIKRMTEDRVRIARDKSPIGRTLIGRPRKRWSHDIRLTEDEVDNLAIF